MFTNEDTYLTIVIIKINLQKPVEEKRKRIQIKEDLYSTI